MGPDPNGGVGDDNLDGGADIDTVDYSANSAAVEVRFDSGQADEGRDGSWNDTLWNIENAIGTDYADKFKGDSSDNVFHAGLGNDDINAGDGADTLYGEGGADTLYGEEGDDVLYGGDGNDSLDGDRFTISGSAAGNDTI